MDIGYYRVFNIVLSVNLKGERIEAMKEDKELMELKSALEENVSPERELFDRINRLIVKPCLEQIKNAAWEIYIEDISEKRAKTILEYVIKELSKEIESTYAPATKKNK
jgi:hypothetical protein